METHIYELKMTIRKITLNVKFPCSLVFQIKNCTSLFIQKRKSLKENLSIKFQKDFVNQINHLKSTSHSHIMAVNTKIRIFWYQGS